MGGEEYESLGWSVSPEPEEAPLSDEAVLKIERAEERAKARDRHIAYRQWQRVRKNRRVETREDPHPKTGGKPIPERYQWGYWMTKVQSMNYGDSIVIPARSYHSFEMAAYRSGHKAMRKLLTGGRIRAWLIPKEGWHIGEADDIDGVSDVV